MKNKNIKDSQSSKYKEGDIVLVKVYGFPWWPCKIVEILKDTEEKYTVLFLNDDKHSYVKESQIKSFSTITEVPIHVTKKLTKNSKKLLEAYEMAKKHPSIGIKEEETEAKDNDSNNECISTQPTALQNEEIVEEKKFLKKKTNRSTSKTSKVEIAQSESNSPIISIGEAMHSDKNSSKNPKVEATQSEINSPKISNVESAQQERNSPKKSKIEVTQLDIHDEDTNEVSTQEEQSNEKSKIIKKQEKKHLTPKIKKKSESKINITHSESNPSILFKISNELENQIEKLSKTNESITEYLNQIKLYVNPSGEKILKSSEDKFSLIHSLEKLKTIFHVQNETNDNLHFFLHSIGEEFGHKKDIKESLKRFPYSKLKGIIKFLKEIVPSECSNPKALNYSHLFNFFHVLIHNTFAKNKVDVTYFNSLDIFYKKIIKGKSLAKLNKKLTGQHLSDPFETRKTETIKKLEMALTSCVKIINIILIK